MIPSHSLILGQILVLISSLLSNVQSHFTCHESFSTAGTNLTHCKNLPTLGFKLGWKHYNTSTNITINVVFSARPPKSGGWVAWGVNPGEIPEMVGTQALIAFVHANGTPVVNTYILTRDTKIGCDLKSSTLKFEVVNKRVDYAWRTGLITVAATLILPMPSYNVSRLNHVWQVGSQVFPGESPVMHGRRLENFDSRETLNLESGVSTGYRYHDRRIVHGVMSVIGWGVLLPTGALFSRYFKGFPLHLNRWFFMHVGIQINAFLIGTIAWGIGLSMVGISEHYKVFMAHRIIGILVFILASLQMMALWLKPNKADSYRKYWGTYHHFTGFLIIGLAILNIFKGLAILKSQTKLRMAYIGILSTLVGVVVALEFTTWFRYYWPHIKPAITKAVIKVMSHNKKVVTLPISDQEFPIDDWLENLPGQEIGVTEGTTGLKSHQVKEFE